MSDAAYTLRAAQPADVGAIFDFIQELAAYEKLSHEIMATEESLRHSLFGESPAAEVVLAEVSGEAVGFALFFTSFSTFLGRPGIYLEDLFVRSEHRGAGIGKALLKHVARIACERRYGRLEWSVLDWNEPAIEFYEQMGATAMSDWTIYRVAGSNLRTMAQPAE